MNLRNGYQTINGVTTARQSQQRMDSTRKRQDFSKSWDVGDKLSVFFPIVWSPYYEDGEPVMEEERDSKGNIVFDENGEPVMAEVGRWDVVVYDAWGHQVNDIRKLNLSTSFLPSLTEVWEGYPVKFERDENGEVVYDNFGEPVYERIEGDVTYQFSKIAPLFVRGMKQAEMDKAMNGKFSSEEFRMRAIADVENKYDTTKNMDAPKPIVDRLRLISVTEVFVVPMDRNDEPLTDKANFYIYRLSQDKITELQTILEDLKYKPRDHKQNWLEVQLSFNGDSNDKKGRAQAGRKAHPIGLTEEYTMRARKPAAFNKVKDKLERLPQLSSTIASHSFYSRKVPESKIKSALSYYMAQNGDYLNNISSEKDTDMMMNNAYYLVKFAALDTMTQENLCTQIRESYEKYMAEHEDAAPVLELATEATDYKEPDLDRAPSVRDLIKENPDLELPDNDDLLA